MCVCVCVCVCVCMCVGTLPWPGREHEGSPGWLPLQDGLRPLHEAVRTN